MKPINLFGTGLHASNFAVAAENRLNCFYEIRKDETGVRVIVRGTPGSYPLYALPTGPVRGMRVVGDILYVVAAGFLFSVTTAGVIAKVANMPTTTGRVSMSDNYVQICIVDGTGGYIYDIGAGTLTTISDINFPNGCTTVTFLSGRFITEKPLTREFYVSAALDGLVWTASSLPIYATKEQYSDLLSAVDSFNGVLVLWGTGSTEYWQDAGLTPEPFQKITGTTQTYGLAAKYSRAIVNNELIFLGVAGQGGVSVFSITGYQPTKISTPDVEDIIATMALSYDITDAVAMTYSVSGHDMYQLTFPTADKTLLYDCTTKLWSIAQTGVLAGRHYGDISVVFDQKNVFCDSTTENLYSMSTVAYSDDGNVIVHQVTTKHIRNGSNEFSITELQLQMDTGDVPQGADYHISMAVSRDNGRTFGSDRTRTVGRVGQYSTPRVKWDRLGSARDFVLRFTLTDPIPFIIAGADIEMSAETA